MIKRIGLVSIVGLSVIISGCGAKESGSAAVGQSESTTISGDAEVLAFKGGYGIDFYQKSAEELQAKTPGLKFNVDGDPRVWEKLQPRFVSNTPPDLIFPGWGMDHWVLAEEEQIVPLDDTLSEMAYDGKTVWRDTFEPSLLNLCKMEGKTYVLPYYFNVMGWWYDPGVFAKNGWVVPKTTAELLALCEKIKAKGMAPITFQGKYPYYMIEGMLLPWTVSIGGAQAGKDLQNLEPGAWKSDAILQATKLIDELNKKGYFQKGAVGMSHTESQQEFLNGKAAMIPCGTWLYAEMQSNIPTGAKMEFMLPPVVAGGKGEPSSLIIGIEPWMIPSKAKNPQAGIALFKYMTSVEKAKQFVQEKGTLTAIKGSDEVELPEVLKVPAKVFKESKDVWAVQYRQWYPKFHQEIEKALTSLLNGELTPEQFCEKAEAEAEKTRKDSSVTKHKL